MKKNQLSISTIDHWPRKNRPAHIPSCCLPGIADQDRLLEGEKEAISAGIDPDDPQAVDFVLGSEPACECWRGKKPPIEGQSDVDFDETSAHGGDDTTDQVASAGLHR